MQLECIHQWQCAQCMFIAPLICKLFILRLALDYWLSFELRVTNATYMHVDAVFNACVETIIFVYL